FSPTDPAPGDNVFFNASSSTSSGSYSWDFGDGSSGSGVSPVHAYGAAHIYTVTLTVTNALGQSATVSKTVTVATPSSQLVGSGWWLPTDALVSDHHPANHHPHLVLDHRCAAAARDHRHDHNQQHEGDHADGDPHRALPPDATAATAVRVDVDVQPALRRLTL